jgi:hypothetical protein
MSFVEHNKSFHTHTWFTLERVPELHIAKMCGNVSLKILEVKFTSTAKKQIFVECSSTAILFVA